MEAGSVVAIIVWGATLWLGYKYKKQEERWMQDVSKRREFF